MFGSDAGEKYHLLPDYVKEFGYQINKCSNQCTKSLDELLKELPIAFKLNDTSTWPRLIVECYDEHMGHKHLELSLEGGFGSIKTTNDNIVLDEIDLGSKTAILKYKDAEIKFNPITREFEKTPSQ